MKSSNLNRTRAKKLGLGALVAVTALTLASCAGGAGGGEEPYEGEGFPYGASQEEVNAVLEDLDPITITYQAAAASEQALPALMAKAFVEEVERRSNGKITVDVVYGQAIANFVEMYDALADGRIDVAWGLPAFAGQQFAASNDVGIAAAQILPSSIYAGELVSMAVMDEVGWQSETLLAAYEDLGITPLTPALYSGLIAASCTQPLVTEDDFVGTTIRVPSQGVFAAVTALGGTPVSLQFGEAFEALQRGTVECNLGGYGGTAESGLTAIAPDTSYGEENRFPITPAASLAGVEFSTWPVAYQQIIFDAAQLGERVGQLRTSLGAAALGIANAKEAGGSFAPFSDDVQEKLAEVNQTLLEEAIGRGNLPEDVAEFSAERSAFWWDKAEELGFVDGGDFADFDEWYDEDTDFLPFVTYLYENSPAMDHRPE